METEQKTLKLGAIGIGGIWKAHAKNLAMLGGNEVVAMCDLSEEHRRTAESQGARAYATIGEMTQNEPELDAIISCTPAAARVEVVRQAVQFKEQNGRDLPVFVEKPPAFSPEDARTVVQLAEQSGVPVAVGFMYRYFPIVDRMRELLGDRTVHLVQSSFYCPLVTKWIMPPWFFLQDRSGGHILDQAIHSIDLIRFLVGDITQVHSFGNNILKKKSEDFTIEESSSTNLRFASGASGAHLHSWTHAEFKVTITLIGEDFRLTLELDERLSGFIGDQKIDESCAPMPEGASHHYEEMRAFLGAVRSNDFSSMRSPYPDAARSLATVLAMNQSIQTGVPVDVLPVS